MEDLAAEIARHGSARRRAREKAASHLEAIRELAPRAIAAGMQKQEIAELAQISRVTLDRLIGEH